MIQDSFFNTHNRTHLLTSSEFERPNWSRNQYLVGEFVMGDIQCSRCSKKFLTIRGWKHHFNVIHDRYNLRTNLLNYVNTTCNRSLSESTEIFACWKCNKKYQYNEDRVQHFTACHFVLFPSTDNVLEPYLKSPSIPTVNRLNDLKAGSHKLRESFKCWKCDKQLKSQNGRLYHFIQKHARTVLANHVDPSNSLKSQIEMLDAKVDLIFQVLMTVN